MTEPRWLALTVVLAIHSDQIREHGGARGVRDKGLLESALARPQNTFEYEAEADLLDLAACYGFGIVRNHPFVDGNKRVSFQAMYTFLGLNGVRLDASEPEVVSLMLALADGSVGEPELAAWLRTHTTPR